MRLDVSFAPFFFHQVNRKNSTDEDGRHAHRSVNSYSIPIMFHLQFLNEISPISLVKSGRKESVNSPSARDRGFTEFAQRTNERTRLSHSTGPRRLSTYKYTILLHISCRTKASRSIAKINTDVWHCFRRINCEVARDPRPAWLRKRRPPALLSPPPALGVRVLLPGPDLRYRITRDYAKGLRLEFRRFSNPIPLARLL